MKCFFNHNYSKIYLFIFTITFPAFSMDKVEKDIPSACASSYLAPEEKTLEKAEKSKEILYLKGMNISALKATQLISSLPPQSLKHLDLSGNQINDTAIQLITQRFPHLTLLKIADTFCTYRSIDMITECLPHLRTLNVSHITFNKTTAKGIGKRLLQLRNLKAENCNLTSSICKHLTESLEYLENLSLAFNHFNVKGFYGLAANKHANISRLNLKFNYISGLEVLKLSQSPWFINLESLNLSRNKIGDYALSYICQHLTNLRILKLCTCFVKDHHALIISDNLVNLRVLKLEANEISDEGATSLVAAQIRDLKILNLLLNPIHESGITALSKYKKENFGTINIYWSPDPLEELKQLEQLGTILE